MNNYGNLSQSKHITNQDSDDNFLTSDKSSSDGLAADCDVDETYECAIIVVDRLCFLIKI